MIFFLIYKKMISCNFNCNHKENISFFCNEGCWESIGLSSRLLEMHMKNIKGKFLNLLKLDMLDIRDFISFSKVLESHLDWKDRFQEMKRY